MKENTKVTIVAVASAVLFGMSFLGTKYILDVMTPFQLMAARWTMALAAFLLLIATGRVKVSYKGKPMVPLLILAFFQPCMYSLFETLGIDLSTIGESAIILAIMPVFITAASILIFRTRVSPMTIGAVILAFTGVVITVVFSDRAGEEGQLLGYVFLGLAILAGSSYSFLSGRLSEKFSPMELTFAMVLTGSIWFNILAFAGGKGPETYVILVSSPTIFFSAVYLGVFCSIASFAMLNYVLARMPTYKASAITMNLITLTGVLTGLLFRGEVLRWNTVVGMIFILLGVVGSGREKERKD